VNFKEKDLMLHKPVVTATSKSQPIDNPVTAYSNAHNNNSTSLLTEKSNTTNDLFATSLQILGNRYVDRVITEHKWI